MFKKISVVFLLLIMQLSTFVVAAERIRSYQVEANPQIMDQIASDFEVVKKLPEGYEVYVLEERANDFLQLAPQARLLQADIHFNEVLNWTLGGDRYRKFADVENDLKTLASKYQSLAQLSTYGVSSEGRNLYVLKLSSGSNDAKSNLMITAATHGDELITTEVLFTLTNELLEGYQKNPRLTKILNTHDIYIVPVVSPDSFEQRERYVNGADPNRSYPWPENLKGGNVDVINALMGFVSKIRFAGSMDLHAYGKLVMYPWGYTKMSPPAEDKTFFDNLVQSMSRENRYTAGQISTTIYVAKGSSADYYYWKHGTRALGVELGDEKIPNYSQIPSVVNQAREMVWTFMENFN